MALAAYADARADRDRLIREAVALGISKTEIARLAGLTRTHLYRILETS